jgi:hypothetical protein
MGQKKPFRLKTEWAEKGRRQSIRDWLENGSGLWKAVLRLDTSG